jgi:hypothetical protein
MKKTGNRFLHGHSLMGPNRKGSPEYRAWLGMRGRCTNEKLVSWKYYGARGIRVCKRWDSFECFLADMGTKPTPRHSLDRINNDGNYEPGNCRWATPSQQSRNRRFENVGVKPVDLTGKKFHRLTATTMISSQGGAKWLCICECGRMISVFASNLVRGHSKSCGCYKSEVLKKPKVTHCARGHLYNSENTGLVGIHRFCRLCARANNKAYRARQLQKNSEIES